MKLWISLTLFATLIAVTGCHSNRQAASAATVQAAADDNDFERDGSSFEKAVKIKSVREEYQWVAAHHQSLELKSQTLIFKDKKPFDVLTYKRTDGSEQKFYFDISSFYGKF